MGYLTRIKNLKGFKGINAWHIGNLNYIHIGIVIRNLAVKKRLSRRYIRFILTLFNNSFTIEWRLLNNFR
jgi:hypothetical protein